MAEKTGHETRAVMELLDGQTAVIAVHGEITALSAPVVRERLHEAIAGGRSHLVVDLSAAPFIDSSGLGALVSGLRKAREAGGDVRLAGVTPKARLVFEVTRLDRVFHLHPTVAEALAAFERGRGK